MYLLLVERLVPGLFALELALEALLVFAALALLVRLLALAERVGQGLRGGSDDGLHRRHRLVLAEAAAGGRGLEVHDDAADGRVHRQPAVLVERALDDLFECGQVHEVELALLLADHHQRLARLFRQIDVEARQERPQVVRVGNVLELAVLLGIFLPRHAPFAVVDVVDEHFIIIVADADEIDVDWRFDSFGVVATTAP